MKQYVVDAFTDNVFAGNPAAVCVMDKWLDDRTMQNIAVENNLSETAFAVKEGGAYHLRWFTPGGEVELCGHATLATAYVITRFVESELKTVAFDTLSGRLTVEKQDGVFTEFDEGLWSSLVEKLVVRTKTDVTVVFKDGTEIKAE